ncbi:ABC transporter permease [Xanthocytophaga flava]|uniref:ABC transporter permease n=1 Tax=Xanthocytophaga flava TaxID=3048013 RepID=UPI0028D8FDA6|nr:ABC transporter permease [Xanthocytophaga flavus]MDJ1469114.1 ABC transporter permease [Xanthocytophaga flavus]
MLKNYLKTAWRNLVKDKTHSFINVMGLSIGMAVAMAIGLWVYDEVSYNKNFKNYNRIAQVIQNLNNNGEVQTWWAVPYPLAEELRTHYSSDFKHIAMAVNWGEHLLTIGDKKLKQTGGFFEKEMPDIFTLAMQRGSHNALQDPSSVLISASAAKSYFGDAEALNQSIQIDKLPSVKVAGIYEDFPQNSTFANLHFIASWDFYYKNSDMQKMPDPWRPNFTSLFVELNENADIDAVNQRIRDAKLRKINSELQKKKPALFLMPMSGWHLYSEFKNGVNTGGAIQYVWMFGIIGGFVLLLACINFMNLSTARSEKRAKEVGIRKAIGSVRQQLIAQFFSESFLTVLFAFVLSTLFVRFSLSFFNEIADKQMQMPWNSVTFWLICSLFVVITALISGSYPAVYLSSFKPVKVLKGTFKAGRNAAIPRKVLMVVQFTVSVTLIIGTIVVYQQIQFAKDRPVGYSRANLLQISTSGDAIHSHFNAVKDELLQAGVITHIAESESPTTDIWNTTSGVKWPGKDPNLSTDFGVLSISFDYGKTIGWQIKEGRDFSQKFTTDSSAVILNETAVRFMNLKNPVGQTITWWDQPLKVIGVVHDMVMGSPYSEAKPSIYGILNYPGNLNILKLNPKISAVEALHKIEPVFKKFNPDQPFEYSFVDDDYAKKFGNEERVGKLANIFAVLAIIISGLGLFGLTSFVAEQRKKEIGVRKVLGASVWNVWSLLSKDFLVLFGISFLIAIPLSSYFMQNWLQNYTYRTSLSWFIFVAAGIGSLSITLLVVSFQAIRAAIANPVRSLRTE